MSQRPELYDVDRANSAIDAALATLQGVVPKVGIDRVGALLKQLANPANALSTREEVAVAHWDSEVYGGASPSGDIAKPFVVNVSDQRLSHGQIYVDIGGDTSNPDDLLSAIFEVNTLPETQDDVQCMRLNFDGDNHAAAFFKQGDRYVVYLDKDVTLAPAVLSNGDQVYILE